ncbi:MAG: sigma-70 family RNA polymerase sigma factor [Lachnospiraceae bacterium]|nr:sigma-70 family RNA polymerase sigma factor [Lachnospiraceae bacterium]
MRTEEEIICVVNKYSDTIVKLALSYVKNKAAAEDIAQDVLFKYMTERKVFDNSEHEKAWLIRVTTNCCKKHLRSFWISRRVDFDFSMLEGTDKNGVGEGIFEELMKLPEKYRIPMHLFYYEDYSVSEIAAILGKKENTVLSYLHRGREALRKTMVRENGYE